MCLKKIHTFEYFSKVILYTLDFLLYYGLLKARDHDVFICITKNIAYRKVNSKEMPVARSRLYSLLEILYNLGS